MSLGYSAQGVDRGVAECFREARAEANFNPLTHGLSCCSWAMLYST